MRNESELCTILKNSFIAAHELAWKIPDPSSTYSQTIQRPFDLIATSRGRMIFIEAKWMSEFGSFNLQRVEDHQIEALRSWKEKTENSESWVVLGINVARGDNRIYVFKDVDVIASRREAKENFRKAELETLPYYAVRKGLIELN